MEGFIAPVAYVAEEGLVEHPCEDNFLVLLRFSALVREMPGREEGVVGGRVKGLTGENSYKNKREWMRWRGY